MSEDKGQKIEICPNGRVWDVGHFVWSRDGVIFTSSNFCVAVKKVLSGKKYRFRLLLDKKGWGILGQTHFVLCRPQSSCPSAVLFTGDFERQRIFTHSIYTFIPKSNLESWRKSSLKNCGISELAAWWREVFSKLRINMLEMWNCIWLQVSGKNDETLKKFQVECFCGFPAKYCSTFKYQSMCPPQAWYFTFLQIM